MDLVKMLKQKIRVTSAVVRGPKGNKGDQGDKGEPGDGVVYFDGEIDTTISTSQSQNATVDKFYPDVQDGYYFVDRKGAIGHVMSVYDTDVVYKYAGKNIKPDAGTVNSVNGVMPSPTTGDVAMSGAVIPYQSESEIYGDDKPGYVEEALKGLEAFCEEVDAQIEALRQLLTT